MARDRGLRQVRTGVLAVGVEDYPVRMASLRGVAGQALRFAKWAAAAGVEPSNIALATSWMDEGEHPEDLPFREYGTDLDGIRRALEHLGGLEIDNVLIYWVGHGLTDSREGRRYRCLFTSDAIDPRASPQYVRLEEMEAFLANRYAGRSVSQVRIVDACATSTSKIEGTYALLFDIREPPEMGDLSYLLTSTRPGIASVFDPDLGSSVFSRLVLEWLDHQSLPLDLTALSNHVIDGIDEEIANGSAMCREPSMEHFAWGKAIRLPGRARYHARARQLADLEGPFSEASATFAERRSALGEIRRWLEDPQQEAALVVTGDSGSGKTALLGVVANLATLGRGHTVRHDGWDGDCVPAEGSIHGVIHAEDRRLREVLASVALAAELPDAVIESIAAGRPIDDAVGVITEHLRAGQRTIVVLVDAVDRAEEPERLIRDVLQPLLAGGRVRLLVGGRGKWDLSGLPRRLIDLDGRFADPEAVRTWVATRLRTPSAGAPSPWGGADPQTVVVPAACRIAKIAGSSFMLARLIADSQSVMPPPEVADDAWEAGLPGSIREVMVSHLSRQGAVDDPKRAFDLLLPLTYALGDGMPWSLWCELANAFSPQRNFNPGGEQALREALARYVTATRPEGSDDLRYRLRHAAIGYALPDPSAASRDVHADHRQVVQCLVGGCTPHPSGRLDWRTASPYALAHVVDHARRAEAADDLLVDLGLVLHAEAAQLLGAFETSRRDDVGEVGRVFRSAMRWPYDASSLGERAAQFSLAARQARTELLSDEHAAELGAPWTASWASWRLRSPHRRLVYGKRPVHCVALAERDGTTWVLAGGGDGHVRTWALSTGEAEKPDRAGEVTCLVADGGLVLSGNADDAAVRRWSPASGDLTPFTEHHAPVRAVATARQDGVVVAASGDESGYVYLWEAETGELVSTEANRVGDAAVSAIAMTDSTDHSLVVVVALEDGSVHVREPGTWRRLELPGHDSGRVVHALAARPHPDGGTVLVTGGADHRVRAFRLGNGVRDADTEPLWEGRHSEAVHAVTVGSVDGAAGGFHVVVSGSDDGSARVWDLDRGGLVGVPYTGHGGWVRAVAVRRFSDGTKVVSGGADGAVHIWELTRSGPVRGPFEGHARTVRALTATSHQGTDLLLSGSLDGTVRQWDAVSGADRGEFLAGGWAGASDWIGALAAVEVGGGTSVVTAGQSGVRVFREGQRPQTLSGHTGWVGSLVEADLGDSPAVVAAGYDGVPRVWNVATAVQHSCYGGPGEASAHAAPVHALALVDGSADGVGPNVVSAGGDREIHVWDPATGAGIRRLDRHDPSGSVRALAAHGSLLFSAGDDGLITVHDVARGSAEPVVTVPARTGRVNALVVVAVGGELRLVSAGEDGALRCWLVTVAQTDGEVRIGLEHVGEVHAHRGPARSLHVAPRGEGHVIYSGGDDGRIGVWDPYLSPVAGGGHEGWVRAVVVTRDEKNLPIAVSGGDDATIRIWDLATGAAARRPVPVGRRGSIRSIAARLRLGAPVVVLGSTDNAVRMLDLSGPRLEPLLGHRDWVGAVDVATVEAAGCSVDVVVSASDDGTVRMWHLETGEFIRTLPTGDLGSVRTMSVVPDGQPATLLLGSRNHHVSTFPLVLDGGARKVLVDDLGHAVQSVAAVRLDGAWVVLARDDSGALVARRLADGGAFTAPPSGVGEVGVVATKGPGASVYVRSPRVAVASGEVVTVSEWADGAWRVVAVPNLGSDVLALDFDESGRRLLVGARRGVAVIALAPASERPQA